ncbi:alpha/beta hydrolase [Labedaea rhizosphaerae]|uniref:Alpha/beta hydrolase family protein n=1 Tax=Labedaea rhizosphaerae TaxID=598644 RepID=A0A4R6SMA6_LABRH|nr:alpha/beta hydrolase [Labedaea rhizosphaerae]TDQ05408.1 alpha/beta hydrolase family protein [Labedaea rhizosphaerae]
MGEPDPEVTYRQLASGDVARIREAARPLASAQSSLTEAIDALDSGRTTAQGGWHGTAADSAVNSIAIGGRASQTAQTRIGWAAQILDSLADRYGQVRTAADEAIGVWRSRVAGTDETALARQVNGVLSGLRDSWGQTLQAHASKLDEIEPAFNAEAGTQPNWASTATTGTLAVPPPSTDPKQVAQWWAGLSETERDQLLAARFDELGRLRGLPADVLDAANTRRVQVDQARYGGQRVQLDDQIAARARELGLDPADTEKLRESNDPALNSLLDQRSTVDRRLANANAAAQRILDAEKLAQQHGIDDTYVLSYDPDGPGRKEGTLAIAFGNPDTADNLAVVVPGTATTLASGFPNGSAADLWSQMGEAAPGSRNSTIAWLGYDAPTWDLSVATSHNAAEGGQLLAADVDGYRAAAQGPQHLTVIGHSYGSTTVGYAALDGLKADDIAFVGSPGVGASNADQFPMGHDHVWAGAAEHDPIVELTSGDWFTKDGSSTGPYDSSFGANVFGTKDDTNLLGAHSNYYDPGSESLRNLGNIATGHYDAVSGQNPLDSPLPPHLPGSDLPIVGPVIDDLGNVGKETIDIGSETVTGLWDTGGDLVHGDWDGALQDLQHTGTAVLNDAGDLVVGAVGDAGEAGHQLVHAGKSAWDNTVGRLF